MMYKLIRKFLFCFDPEIAHRLTLITLRLASKLNFVSKIFPPYPDETQVFGLTFPNKIGLAAGFDKNGEYVDALSQLGFGFIEIGTVTPRPQQGNPKPRLFRITDHQALINRMGFNNDGLDILMANIKKPKRHVILGISIGKNATTPQSGIIDDYLICLERVYTLADYVAINISSPNTEGLRKLQNWDLLSQLLLPLKAKQTDLNKKYKKYVPLLVKIAPDLSDEEIMAISNILLQVGIDGVIATNTTTSRHSIEKLPIALEAGGLSGLPLTSRAREVVQTLYKFLEGKIPIIASGGVMTPADVGALIEAGASLVQIYTGLIYNGPSLISRAARVANETTRKV